MKSIDFIFISLIVVAAIAAVGSIVAYCLHKKKIRIQREQQTWQRLRSMEDMARDMVAKNTLPVHYQLMKHINNNSIAFNRNKPLPTDPLNDSLGDAIREQLK